MTIPPFIAIVVILFAVFWPSPAVVDALGSGNTVAVIYGSRAVCGIVAGEKYQRIQCYINGRVFSVEPYKSFSAITGGRNSFCGLRSGGYSLLCWDILISPDITFRRKRVYLDDDLRLKDIAIGDYQICGLVNLTGTVKCWRGVSPDSGQKVTSISSGSGFSCGILKNSTRVLCWGRNEIGNLIEKQFADHRMVSIVSGDSHACGLNESGFIICKGSNSFGQLDSPPTSAMEYVGLAMGKSHGCAIRQPTGSVICWGGGEEYSPPNDSFVSVVAGLNFTCGLTTRNFSVICWGPGWPIDAIQHDLPLSTLLPGPCVQSSCSDCGIYPQSGLLCSGEDNICKPCISSTPPSKFPLSPSSTPKSLSRGLLAFAIVGSIGCVSGVCTFIFWLWSRFSLGKKKIHNSVQPTITAYSSSPPSRSSTIRGQGSRIIRRNRSGTSSNKHSDRAEQFSLTELAFATNNFSPENKIGSGSFGMVYRGKLRDGREVAIKRSSETKKMKKLHEKEMAFDSELAFLSRLHHKHLVRLVGYCVENEERLLVYEFMKNGALYNHLHDEEKNSDYVNSWKTRIKFLLDAARGIDYLHSYAVPPIIHRDIKSSNILLDENWTARVSDFGLSLSNADQNSSMKAAGTVGYIDPEYYTLNTITSKSDVYGLGVVLLELLTGKKAIFKEDGMPMSIVDYAVPAIRAGEVEKVLDVRVGKAELNEAEAVELVAYTAMHSVNMEGKERPTMADIVGNLERALVLCEDNSHGSISSGSIMAVSE